MALTLGEADFDELLVFTRVVEMGGFSAAATALEMPKSTVSRKVSDLEARVGARLLQRTTRKMSLTEVGRAYYEQCVRILTEVEAAAAVVSELHTVPRGLLRVTVPMTFAFIAPLLAELLEESPEVQLDLVCTDRQVDLIEERFDVALRAGSVPDSTLVARHLGTVRRFLVASPDLVQRLGAPETPADLERYPRAVFAPVGSTWSLRSGKQAVEVVTRPRFATNDYDMLRAMVRSGFGVALLPEYQCAEEVDDHRLVRVLSSWAGEEVPLFALYPSARHVPPKVLALLKLLRDRLDPGGRARRRSPDTERSGSSPRR
jgi:DNA-binding transcriptional LysR family regulator